MEMTVEIAMALAKPGVAERLVPPSQMAEVLTVAKAVLTEAAAASWARATSFMIGANA